MILPSATLERMKPISEVEYVVDPTSGCWVWQRAKNNGYGLKCMSAKRGGNQYAHRYMYEKHVGPIPEGLDLDHLCHDPNECVGGKQCPHRACVNPAHLEPVTRKENLRRGPGSLTHCKRGHEFTDENTYIKNKDGRRSCRTCRNETALRYYYAKKGET